MIRLISARLATPEEKERYEYLSLTVPAGSYAEECARMYQIPYKLK